MRRTVNIWANTDWTVVFLYALMVIMGWLNIYSVVYNEEHSSIFDFSQRYGRQLVWILFAFTLAFLTMLMEGRFFLFFSYLFYALAILSLILVLLVGTRIHGSKSWFSVGSLAIQPAEFAKVAVALTMARYLSAYNIKIRSFKTIATSIALMVVPAILVLLQPDTGSAIVFLSFFIVLFREGLPISFLLLGFLAILLFILSLFVEQWILFTGLMGIALLTLWWVSGKVRFFLVSLLILSGAVAGVVLVNYLFHFGLSLMVIFGLALLIPAPIFAYFLFRYRFRQGLFIYLMLGGLMAYSYSADVVMHRVLSEHQQRRIKILLGIESDPFGYGYNINQSKIAIGSGGFWGKGYLQGTQTKFHFVPEQSTDFIFCTVGEEWGFVGSAVIILLYLFLLIKIIIMAERQRSSFTRTYGYGVFSVLFLHFFINIGMTIGLVPVIGIPLPFFSYGGSSLWAFTLLLFIFIRLDASRLELL